jgi:hypothetical protein
VEKPKRLKILRKVLIIQELKNGIETLGATVVEQQTIGREVNIQNVQNLL